MITASDTNTEILRIVYRIAHVERGHHSDPKSQQILL